jgi:hypothetical protein
MKNHCKYKKPIYFSTVALFDGWFGLKFYWPGEGFVGFAVDDQGPGFIIRVLDCDLSWYGDQEGVGGDTTCNLFTIDVDIGVEWLAGLDIGDHIISLFTQCS